MALKNTFVDKLFDAGEDAPVLDSSPDPVSSESSPARNSSRKFSFVRWERICWLVAFILGFLQAWGRRHDSADGLPYLGPDAISYMDIGDAYMRGDWYIAVNAMWSPLYSWLVGITLRLFKPSPYWEFTTVRLLNVLIYLFALFGFAFLLRELRNAHEQSRSHPLPDWIWAIFGYTLFIWTSLFMNRVSRTSPDLLVAALIFVAGALLLRIRVNPSSWQLFVLLGAVLGIGYLTKTIMFPLAFVLAGAAAQLARRKLKLKDAFLRAAVSFVIFLALAIPFVVVISRAKQRLTIGDTARLNYAWYVNGTTRFIHWQGEPPGSGTPIHPTRKIFATPAVYEFASPPGISYPPWYDPSYWYEGVTPHFSLRQQLAAVLRNLSLLYGFLSLRFFLVVIGFALFILLYQTGSWRTIFRNVSEYWFLILPSLIAIALYLAVNIESRYLAPFVVLLALSCLAAVQLAVAGEDSRVVSGVGAGIVLLFALAVFPQAARAAYWSLREVSAGASARDIQWQVADGLQRHGLAQNDRVGAIGNTMYAAWPRLARVRVVAEVPELPAGDAQKFWTVEQTVRFQALSAIAATGARIVVAEDAPRWSELEGWQRLKNTNYYFLVLSR